MVFRNIARATATAHLLLVVPENGYPFKMFDFLDNEDPALFESHLAAHRDEVCLFDPISREYLTEYATVERLQSPEARLELKVRAMLIDLCIARVESKWSRVRRLCQVLTSTPGC